MPITVQPVFGSFNYANGYAGVESWNDDLDYTTIVVPVPRSDRARDGDGYLRPRRVDLKGTIGRETWTSRDDLRNAVDAFAYAHRPGRRNLYRDTDRYLRNAQVESLRFQADTGLLWSEYSLRFIVADPYFYATTGSSDTWGTPTNGNTRTVNNQGAATALPVFTVEMSSSGTLGLTIENNTTGESFVIAALAVTSGDELVIDCDQETVKLEGANKMSAFDGSFFALAPGNNELELTLSGVTLASIETAWVRRWL